MPHAAARSLAAASPGPGPATAMAELTSGFASIEGPQVAIPTYVSSAVEALDEHEADDQQVAVNVVRDIP